MSGFHLDSAGASQFISSLSKSLQALCHGLVEFDVDIEIFGHLNIRVDKLSGVNYILDEKVEKVDNDSVTFVSNSFVAKKEVIKETKDMSCSPMDQFQGGQLIPEVYQNYWSRQSEPVYDNAIPSFSGYNLKRAINGEEMKITKKRRGRPPKISMDYTDGKTNTGLSSTPAYQIYSGEFAHQNTSGMMETQMLDVQKDLRTNNSEFDLDSEVNPNDTPVHSKTSIKSEPADQTGVTKVSLFDKPPVSGNFNSDNYNLQEENKHVLPIGQKLQNNNSLSELPKKADSMENTFLNDFLDSTVTPNDNNVIEASTSSSNTAVQDGAAFNAALSQYHAVDIEDMDEDIKVQFDSSNSNDTKDILQEQELSKQDQRQFKNLNMGASCHDHSTNQQSINQPPLETIILTDQATRSSCSGSSQPPEIFLEGLGLKCSDKNDFNKEIEFDSSEENLSGNNFSKKENMSNHNLSKDETLSEHNLSKEEAVSESCGCKENIMSVNIMSTEETEPNMSKTNSELANNPSLSSSLVNFKNSNQLYNDEFFSPDKPSSIFSNFNQFNKGPPSTNRRSSISADKKLRIQKGLRVRFIENSTTKEKSNSFASPGKKDSKNKIKVVSVVEQLKEESNVKVDVCNTCVNPPSQSVENSIEISVLNKITQNDNDDPVKENSVSTSLLNTIESIQHVDENQSHLQSENKNRKKGNKYSKSPPKVKSHKKTTTSSSSPSIKLEKDITNVSALLEHSTKDKVSPISSSKNDSGKNANLQSQSKIDNFESQPVLLFKKPFSKSTKKPSSCTNQSLSSPNKHSQSKKITLNTSPKNKSSSSHKIHSNSQQSLSSTKHPSPSSKNHSHSQYTTLQSPETPSRSQTNPKLLEENVQCHENKCPHCSEEMEDDKALQAHISKIHEHQMPFICSICGKGHQTERNLEYHMKAHNKVKRKWKCPLCEIKVTQQFDLATHLKLVHKQMQCQGCKLMFNHEEEFNFHLELCENRVAAISPK